MILIYIFFKSLNLLYLFTHFFLSSDLLPSLAFFLSSFISPSLPLSSLLPFLPSFPPPSLYILGGSLTFISRPPAGRRAAAEAGCSPARGPPPPRSSITGRGCRWL